MNMTRIIQKKCQISYLVRTKLHPINRAVGCYKRDSKRCEVLKYSTSTVAGKPLR